MGGMTVALLGEKGYGRKVGKKGSESDITLYNLKSSENVVTSIEPSAYPEKMAPLSYVLSMSDLVVFVVDRLDRHSGELLLAIDSMEKTRGIFVGGDRSAIGEIVRGTCAERFEFLSDDISLREKLLAMSSEVNKIEGNGAVVVDGAFKVKGVGTVVLGVVTRGCVRRHDALNILPDGGKVQIRSIQKQDVNCDRAYTGDRVGLALRGAEPENVGRGSVLTSDALECSRELEISMEKSTFFRGEVRDGSTVHVGHWMQFIQGKIEGNRISLEKPMVVERGENLFVCQLNSSIPRIMGRCVVMDNI